MQTISFSCQCVTTYFAVRESQLVREPALRTSGKQNARIVEPPLLFISWCKMLRSLCCTRAVSLCKNNITSAAIYRWCKGTRPVLEFPQVFGPKQRTFSLWFADTANVYWFQDTAFCPPSHASIVLAVLRHGFPPRGLLDSGHGGIYS